jgi:hypothetical protein
MLVKPSDPSVVKQKVGGDRTSQTDPKEVTKMVTDRKKESRKAVFRKKAVFQLQCNIVTP